MTTATQTPYSSADEMVLTAARRSTFVNILRDEIGHLSILPHGKEETLLWDHFGETLSLHTSIYGIDQPLIPIQNDFAFRYVAGSDTSRTKCHVLSRTFTSEVNRSLVSLDVAFSLIPSASDPQGTYLAQSFAFQMTVYPTEPFYVFTTLNQDPFRGRTNTITYVFPLTEFRKAYAHFIRRGYTP